LCEAVHRDRGTAFREEDDRLSQDCDHSPAA
jgi:hypothetical protein